LTRVAGAVAVDPHEHPFDVGVADHYGDPLREQRLLAQGQGVVDLGHRGVVRVDGPDRLSWLHSLLSQHVEHLEVGVGVEALLLSPNGHVEQHVHLVDDGTATWIHTEPGMQADFVRFLDSMRFMLRVEVVDVTEAWAVVWFPDVERGQAVAESSAGAIVVPAQRGLHVLLPRDTYGDVVVSVGDPAGVWAYEALRVEAHEPRLRLESDHRTIPHEVAWIGPAVHLQKGCYRGQETVARVHNLGRPPRRLVMLHLDGSTNELPAHGDDVQLDGRVIGFVGTAVHHYELGPIALAIVKRAVDVQATLTIDGVSAAQEVIVAP
jgi:folate-binding protein YgfZ